MIDLNADVGESYGAWQMGDDEALLGAVSSANVACGFHAGDPAGIRRTLTAAAAAGVAVGAHVSYPDLVGFGRRPLAATPEEITADVLYQLGALDGLARSAGTAVAYVKAHGALYHAATVDRSTAAALVDAVVAYGRPLALLSPPGSWSQRLAADAGLAAPAEAFPDRAYAPGGSLVARQQPGAVLTDPEEVAARAVRLAMEGTISAVDGSDVVVVAESLCLHGDTPGAVTLAKVVRAALERAEVKIGSFANGEARRLAPRY